MSLSNKAMAEALDTIIRQTAYTFTTSLELALFVSASGGAGADPGGTLPDGDASVTGEVSGGSYTRSAVTFGTPATEADPSVISNTAAIDGFGTASADWAAGANFVSGWSLYDTNATLPNRVSIWAGPFDVGKNVTTNDTVTVAIGNLTLRLARV